MNNNRKLTFRDSILFIVGILMLLSLSSYFSPNINRGIIGDAVIRAAIFAVSIFFIVRYFNLDQLQYLRNKSISDRRIVLLSLVLVVSLYVLTWILTEVEVLLRIGIDEYISKADNVFYLGNSAKYFLTNLVVTPIGEEILFRGCILTLLVRNYHPNIANIYCSLVFSLAHIRFNDAIVSSLIYSFLSGFIFGWIVLRTKNIRLTILIHFIWNLSVYIFSILMIHSGFTISSLLRFYILIGILGVLSIVGFVWAWFVYRAIGRNSYYKQLGTDSDWDPGKTNNG